MSLCYNFDMPEELCMEICNYARPITRLDWRVGSPSGRIMKEYNYYLEEMIDYYSDYDEYLEDHVNLICEYDYTYEYTYEYNYY